MSSHVDDVLLMCTSDILTDYTDFLLHMFEELSLKVSFEKSNLVGNQTIQYNGYVFHTDAHVPWIQIPKCRVCKVKKDVIKNCLNHGQIKARFFARIARQCISIFNAVLLAKLLSRNIYHLLSTREDWPSVLYLNVNMQCEGIVLVVVHVGHMERCTTCSFYQLYFNWNNYLIKFVNWLFSMIAKSWFETSPKQPRTT